MLVNGRNKHMKFKDMSIGPVTHHMGGGITITVRGDFNPCSEVVMRGWAGGLNLSPEGTSSFSRRVRNTR